MTGEGNLERGDAQQGMDSGMGGGGQNELSWQMELHISVA